MGQIGSSICAILSQITKRVNAVSDNIIIINCTIGPNRELCSALGADGVLYKLIKITDIQTLHAYTYVYNTYIMKNASLHTFIPKNVVKKLVFYVYIYNTT